MSDGVQIYLTVLCTIYGLVGLGLFGLMVVGFMTLVNHLITLVDWVKRVTSRNEVAREYGQGTYGDA